MVEVTVQLPDDIAKTLSEVHGSLTQSALEAIALDGYRRESLSRFQVGQLVGLDRFQTDAFLKANEAYLHYSVADLTKDVATLEKLCKP